MKKLFILTLCFIMVLTPISYTAYASDEISVYLDGEKLTFDVPPIIRDGRTLVPMRAIFEALGANVEWLPDTRQVFGTFKHLVIELTIDVPTLYANTIEKTIDVPAQIINDRTFVPIRVISECAGANVEWNDENRSIYITSSTDVQQIDWNDSLYYIGETSENSANGYGVLYYKSDNTLRQIGIYADNVIQEGTDYLNDGAYFTGKYLNGKFSNGIYRYNNGNSYIGEIKDSKRHGHGKFLFEDNMYSLEGEWENDSLNGYAVYYDSVEDVEISGNYVHGLREGDHLVKDFYMNETYYLTYKNGELYTEKDKANEEAQQKIDNLTMQYTEVATQLDELSNEYLTLKEWYDKQMEELYDYVLNGDPTKTDWAKEIYKQYGVTGNTSGFSPADSNLDSYAAANMLRQQQAINAKKQAAAHQAIMEYNETYITNRINLINSTYEQQKASLDSMTKTLEQKLDIINTQIQNIQKTLK